MTWSELFRIHYTTFLVADHLAPRKVTSSSSTAGKDKAADSAPESWERLDAIVLQWIYGTISPGLLCTIHTKNTTAYDAWTALQNLFEDNKASRALYLQAKLTNTCLENFKDMAAYCQEVKTLADQLLNVEVPLTETQLVLKLLGGLTEQYVTIATVLRSKEPLPDFNNFRSSLCHEETQRAATDLYAANSAAAALHVGSNGSANSHRNTTHLDSCSDIRAEYNHEKERLGSNNNSCGRGRGRGRGRHSTGRGRGSFQQIGFTCGLHSQACGLTRVGEINSGNSGHRPHLARTRRPLDLTPRVKELSALDLLRHTTSATLPPT